MPRPDEGLIHAWLDGQLPPAEAARVEQLAATDPEWGAAVAEARGLIAASSRILSSLDNVPAGVIPERKTLQPVWRMPWWTKVAAAIVVVAGGSLMVFERANVPELATAPATKPADVFVRTPPPNAPATAQAPASAVPAAKKSPLSPASAAQRVAASEMKNKENVAVPAAAALTAEAQPKAEGADRGAPVKPQSPLAKDVAAKAADAAPRTVAQTAPSTGSVTAMRAVGGAAAPARVAEPAGAGEQVARQVSGVAAAPAKTQASSSPCYRVRDLNARTDAGVIMRVMNADGDTLRLESAQGKSGLRAWIVWRDGLGHGAMTAADGTGAVAIVATASGCPTP